MSEIQLVNEDTVDIINYINNLDIKKVLLGGYDKIGVYSAIQQLCSMYESILTKTRQQYEEELEVRSQERLQQYDLDLQTRFEEEKLAIRNEYEARIQNLEMERDQYIELVDRSTDCAAQKGDGQASGGDEELLTRIRLLTKEKEELQNTIQLNDQKYKKEVGKLVTMKEQLADMMMKQGTIKEELLAEAETEKQKILSDARKQAEQIIDNRMEEINDQIEAKKRELRELDESRKAGYSIVDNIQSEISQLSFKLTYVKRILAKSEETVPPQGEISGAALNSESSSHKLDELWKN